MIKILLVDDQKLFRESLKSILEQDEEIEVAGCAENGLEALELCDQLQPDIILMDIKMPVCDGIEGTRLIKSKHRNIKIIMLTMIDEDQEIRKALENWADGYILKDVTPEELKQLIKNAANGFTIISQKVYDTVRKELSKGKEAPTPSKENTAAIHLKDKELAIIRLIAAGKNNKEIAVCLDLSEGRVKNIISEMLAKLNLKDRYQLLSFAYKNNLIE